MSSLRNLFVIIIFYQISLSSCNDLNFSIGLEELTGSYIFTYPSGEVEVIIIKSDSSYVKEFYRNKEDFQIGDYVHPANKGTWSVIWNKVTFENWLFYSRFNDPNLIIDKPFYATKRNVPWIRHRNGRKKPILSVYEPNGYEFEKLTPSTSPF
jgi:hypothetical protein